MKNKIVLTIVALVILPTALLSLLAGRAVRNREFLIAAQMRASAGSMTRLCSSEIEAGIRSELNRVKDTVSAVITRTASLNELGQASRDLEKSSRLIFKIIVYHNPWEIIYPLEAPPLIDQSIFIQKLRMEIAQNKTAGDIIISDSGAYHVFTRIQDRKDLYAGFTIDPDGFRNLINRTMLKLSVEEIFLTAKGGIYPGDNTVLIEDSISRDPASQPDGGTTAEKSARPLASAQLSHPFQETTISAYPRDIAKLEQAGRTQSKLLIWGITLLTTGIAAGVIILVFQIHAEIRRTSARANYIIGISHDLRTPVSSLKIMAESLYSGTVKDTDRKQMFLKTMTGECERLNRLIERVLYFVRYGEDALVFFKKTVNPEQMVRETVKSFLESSGDNSRIQCTINAADELPEIEADAQALSQVILNLMDNALKYGESPDHPHSVKITVSLSCVKRKRHALAPPGKWIRLSIADSGKGMSPADLKKLFRPYFRSQAALKANISGVGLGLALCKHIAHSHRGWIEAENLETGGAVFSIYLPAEKSLAPDGTAPGHP